MRGWCSECQFETYDGAEEPCINCVKTYNEKPSEFTPATDEVRDYAEQVKALRRCRIYSCSGCYLRENQSCKAQLRQDAADAIEELLKRPEIPETGIGDLSDGYHTFNSLYYQRMILFAALVRAYKDRAWKSYRHEDGELCFGGGWFIVGIDTPEGSYTYHYENKDFDEFDCVELPRGKHWDGHTEKDVTRLLSLPEPPMKEDAE